MSGNPCLEQVSKRTLYEATQDRCVGIGTPIYRIEENINKLNEKNILGKILQEVRTELAATVVAKDATPISIVV